MRSCQKVAEQLVESPIFNTISEIEKILGFSQVSIPYPCHQTNNGK